MSNLTIAIVGRPNVGKSTIFNRVVGDRISIVQDEPGVTRDRIYAQGEWLGKQLNVIDTGGIEFNDQDFMTIVKPVREYAASPLRPVPVYRDNLRPQTAVWLYAAVARESGQIADTWPTAPIAQTMS